MLPIRPGSFAMGCSEPDQDAWDEAPAHEVAISKSFTISETEVTIEQFQQFRPDFTGSATEEPYATGLSWHDAMAFCEWLSRKEGKPYRLPTEAEWEYAARAGSDTPFWSGAARPKLGAANAWGLKNVHSGPSEWCHDWYGAYPEQAQTDPVGANTRLSKVIRGGGLDLKEDYYARSTNRASYAPAFAMMKGTEPGGKADNRVYSKEPTLEGLIGVWHGRIDFSDPKAVDHLVKLNMDWNDFQQPGEDRESKWSAHWQGTLVAPVSGPVTFHAAADYAVTLKIAGRTIVQWEGRESEKTGTVELEQGKHYPIEVIYIHNRGAESILNIQWSWPGQERTRIERASLLHSPEQQHQMKTQIPTTFEPGHHSIGFRIVQAPLPGTQSTVPPVPFPRACVIGNQPMVTQGPDSSKPWYRKRGTLTIPPVAIVREDIVAAGLHPGMQPHIHNPGLEVCPNGDVIANYFSADVGAGGEDQPNLLLIGTRLRFGAEQWDTPDVTIDFADVNDSSCCLIKEGNTIYSFWGHTFYDRAYPFQWTKSTDNGATWSEVLFPQFDTEIGPRTNQPINSAVRDADGTFYLPSDGKGPSCALWVTKDNMKTWSDPGGRTLGRHTTFVQLKDGRLLGMGGKKAHIDGYMPKSITSDGGKTYQISKTPFPELGSGQRPTIIRLQSGRLFFAGDLQHRTGRFPEAITQRGGYVALSEDEGETWRMKKLPGTQPASGLFSDMNPYDSMGYTVARQAPNGIIHLIGTVTLPTLHWEVNEAWILSDEAGYDEYDHPKIHDVRQYQETYRSGAVKGQWSGGISAAGEYRHHGRQTWYHENGQREWEVTYDAGIKVGEEKYWTAEGRMLWSWEHIDQGGSYWTQYWPNGQPKLRSLWHHGILQGTQKRWDDQGKLLSETQFTMGRVTFVKEYAEE